MYWVSRHIKHVNLQLILRPTWVLSTRSKRALTYIGRMRKKDFPPPFLDIEGSLSSASFYLFSHSPFSFPNAHLFGYPVPPLYHPSALICDQQNLLYPRLFSECSLYFCVLVSWFEILSASWELPYLFLPNSRLIYSCLLNIFNEMSSKHFKFNISKTLWSTAFPLTSDDTPFFLDLQAKP